MFSTVGLTEKSKFMPYKINKLCYMKRILGNIFSPPAWVLSI